MGKNDAPETRSEREARQKKAIAEIDRSNLPTVTTPAIQQTAFLQKTPKGASQWFLRRVWLENKLDEFNGTRKAIAKSYGSYSQTFWPVAKEFFGFKSQKAEMARCKELEAGIDFNSAARAAEIQNLDIHRNHLMQKRDDEAMSYVEEVRWAFRNWPRYVKREGDSFTLRDEGEMQQAAPTTGCIGLLYLALQNLSQFQNLCAKVLGKQDSIDQEDAESDLSADDTLDDLEAVLKTLA